MSETVKMAEAAELTERLRGINGISTLREQFEKSVFPRILEIAGKEVTHVGIALRVVSGIFSLHLSSVEMEILVSKFGPVLIDAICDDQEVAERAKLDIRISFS